MKLFVLILVSIVVFVFFVRYVENKSIFLPDKDNTIQPVSLNPQARDVYFKTEDGVILNGWFFANKKARSTLLFLHGNAGNISHRFEKVSWFYDLGLNIFIIDYRGYGKSEGVPSEQGVYKDAQAAFDYLLMRNDVHPRKIIGYGASLGGAVAVDLATKCELAALIIDSSFSSMQDMVKTIYPFLPGFLLESKMDSFSKVKTLKIPKLFIHSAEDEIVPFDLGEKLFEAACPPKEFLQISGSHNEGYAQSKDIFINGVRDFLRSEGLIR